MSVPPEPLVSAGPGGSPNARAGTWRAWVVWTAFYAAIAFATCRPWHDPAVPAAAAVGEHAFSAERAFVHLDALASKLGRRVATTAACGRAADYVEAELRRIGVETVRQVASGRYELDGTTYVYRGVTNVLARIPGRSARAILVSAHYDSAAEGPGAADNALAVAALVEIVRALRATGPLANTVIVNFNGGEELGLFGAAAFMNHPWFAEVSAFINLDASGGQGRQLLLQATTGGEALVEAYAASVPHVHGTVLAQELFGLFPFDTDYHIYRNAGLRGIDLAPYGDTYAYHTPLDRPDRVSRRTLQDSGENVLALLRGLPALDGEGQGRAPVATYYDVLGLVMVRYSATTARGLGLLVAALALITAWWTRRCDPRPIATLAFGALAVALATLLAILTPVLAGIAITFAGGAMSWFARPWIAIIVYGTATVAGVLTAQSVLRWFARRRGFGARSACDAFRRGLVVCWAVALLATTVLGLGSSYLAMWWCAGAAISAVASSRLRGLARWGVTLGGLAMPAIITAQAAQVLLTSLVPLTGGLGADAPAELVIAAVTALVLAPFAVALGPLIQASSLRRVAAGVALAASAAIALIAISFPYTAARPKRVYVEVRNTAATGAHAVFEPSDPGPRPELADTPLGPTAGRPLPTIAVVPGAASAGSSDRSIELEVAATGAYLVDLRIDGRTTGWSLGNGAASARHVTWIGTSEPLRLRIDKPPGASVRAHVTAHYLGSEIALDHALAQLPSWTIPMVQTVLEASAAL